MDLAELGSLLKCPICFDFYNTCMVTSCSHNYCSLCIRKYLTYKSQCPLCFEETSVGELRNNRLVDDIVTFYLWKSKNRIAGIENKSESGNPSNEDTMAVDGYDQNHQVAEDSSEKASCPVCNLMVKVSSINVHLDLCLNRDDRKDSLRRGTSASKRKKLPKVVYHFLSDKDLKKLVVDANLNSEGDRQALIKRHKLYLVLYNSECDSLNPRSVSDILKQVHEEEEMVEKLSKGNTKGYSVDKNTDPAEIEQKQQEYLKEHHKEFSNLIEDIQRRGIQKNSTAACKKATSSKHQTALDSPCTSKCKEDVEVGSTTEEEAQTSDLLEQMKAHLNESMPDKDINSAATGHEKDKSTSEKALSTKCKLSRKTVQPSLPVTEEEEITPIKRSLQPSDETEEEATSVKRSRHPSDEF